MFKGNESDLYYNYLPLAGIFYLINVYLYCNYIFATSIAYV